MLNTATAVLAAAPPDFAALQFAVLDGTVGDAVEATALTVRPGATVLATDVLAAIREAQAMADLIRAELGDPELTDAQRDARGAAVLAADAATARYLELLGAGQ